MAIGSRARTWSRSTIAPFNQPTGLVEARPVVGGLKHWSSAANDTGYRTFLRFRTTSNCPTTRSTIRARDLRQRRGYPLETNPAAGGEALAELQFWHQYCWPLCSCCASDRHRGGSVGASARLLHHYRRRTHRSVFDLFFNAISSFLTHARLGVSASSGYRSRSNPGTCFGCSRSEA